jgi:hypothetical protein
LTFVLKRLAHFHPEQFKHGAVLNHNSATATAFVSIVCVSLEKMEFAPAMKQSAWFVAESFERPAVSRTSAFGIRIRAVAIIRTTSHTGTSSCSAKGVPGTWKEY